MKYYAYMSAINKTEEDKKREIVWEWGCASLVQVSEKTSFSDLLTATD